MNDKLQFSLRQMLVFVAFFCAVVGEAAAFAKHRDQPTPNMYFAAGSIIAFGYGIGFVVNRLMAGLLFGIVIVMFLGLMFLLAPVDY